MFLVAFDLREQNNSFKRIFCDILHMESIPTRKFLRMINTRKTTTNFHFTKL